ncbi:MAG: hypothetical protein KDB53_12095, partial [Planctomycetes bacterium]|nr:hypothetical protein [Planctomycetota bacterium]
ASLTALAGNARGRVFDLEDFDEIAAAFPHRPRTRIERQSQELWNAPLLVGLTLLLLFAEWVMRKRSRLV